MHSIKVQKSVSGFILCALDIPVSRHSKAQKSMALSSSGAEWVSLLEAFKEVMFIIQLLQCMKISVKLLLWLIILLPQAISSM